MAHRRADSQEPPAGSGIRTRKLGTRRREHAYRRGWALAESSGPCKGLTLASSPRSAFVWAINRRRKRRSHPLLKRSFRLGGLPSVQAKLDLPHPIAPAHDLGEVGASHELLRVE